MGHTKCVQNVMLVSQNSVTAVQVLSRFNDHTRVAMADFQFAFQPNLTSRYTTSCLCSEIRSGRFQHTFLNTIMTFCTCIRISKWLKFHISLERLPVRERV